MWFVGCTTRVWVWFMAIEGASFNDIECMKCCVNTPEFRVIPERKLASVFTKMSLTLKAV